MGLACWGIITGNHLNLDTNFIATHLSSEALHVMVSWTDSRVIYSSFCMMSILFYFINSFVHVQFFQIDQDGRPLENIENDFEDRGDVIIDHTTRLMWQKEQGEFASFKDTLKIHSRDKPKGFVTIIGDCQQYQNCYR